jgi:hypothetical protein
LILNKYSNQLSNTNTQNHTKPLKALSKRKRKLFKCEQHEKKNLIKYHCYKFFNKTPERYAINSIYKTKFIHNKLLHHYRLLANGIQRLAPAKISKRKIQSLFSIIPGSEKLLFTVHSFLFVFAGRKSDYYFPDKIQTKPIIRANFLLIT